MSLSFLVTALNTLASQSPLLLLLVDLTLKSTLILLIACLAQVSLHRKSGSERSIYWVFVIGALLFLPLFHSVLPGLFIPFAIEEAELSQLLSNDMLAFVLGLQSSDSEGMALQAIAIGYGAVCLLMALYLGIGIVRVILMTRRATPCRDERIRSVLQSLLDLNGVTTPVKVRFCSHCSSPLTWGLGKHWILLPRSATRWDRTMLEQSLSHELAHIQRHDWLCYVASRLTICLYWINPLIWIAHSKLVIESEKACDDAVLADTGNSISYAENLLTLASTQSFTRALPVPALFGRQSSLVTRIHHILRQDRQQVVDDRCGVLPGLLLAAILIAPYSALGVTLHIIEQQRTESVMFKVNYFPKESQEYQQYMHEFGRA